MHRRRAADAADAATATPGERAPATKPRRAHAMRVVQLPTPAKQGQARPGPQRTAIDGRPLRAGAREPRRLCARARALRGRARPLARRPSPTRSLRPSCARGARSPRPDATNELRKSACERHRSTQNATGVARRGSRRRSGGQTHTDNLSSVPELPLDSNLRPSDSICTSSALRLVGPAARPEQHPAQSSAQCIANTIGNLLLLCMRRDMCMQMGRRASPAASRQG